MNPIVRHKKTNIPYEYKGQNKFVNLLTGKEGEVDEEMASKVFVINVEMTVLCDEYPLLKEFISKLGLRIEK